MDFICLGTIFSWMKCLGAIAHRVHRLRLHKPVGRNVDDILLVNLCPNSKFMNLRINNSTPFRLLNPEHFGGKYLKA